MRVDTVTSVLRNVYREVTGGGVVFADVGRDTIVIALLGDCVAITRAEGQVLCASDLDKEAVRKAGIIAYEGTHDVDCTNKVGCILDESALGEQDAVGDGLLCSKRALEGGVGEVWGVEEVELIGIRLECRLAQSGGAHAGWSPLPNY